MSKSGFVAIVGQPNVGKSTLLNSILKKKVAIATPKPQTTRDNIRGVLTLEDAQIVFIDTPGIHKAKEKLNKNMVKRAYDAVGDVDIVLLVIDASKPFDHNDELIIDSLSNVNKPKFVVLNKIDKLTKQELIELVNKVNVGKFNEMIPLSALRSRNIDELVKTLIEYLPEDVMYYPADMITDYPEKFMWAEIIREKIMLNTVQEIPHAIAVTIENYERHNQALYIQAAVICERDSQKGIIIGKNGAMLKKIATFAREELEERLGCNVFLEVFVKVEKDWRNKKSQLEQFGYWDTQDGQ